MFFHEPRFDDFVCFTGVDVFERDEDVDGVSANPPSSFSVAADVDVFSLFDMVPFERSAALTEIWSVLSSQDQNKSSVECVNGMVRASPRNGVTRLIHKPSHPEFAVDEGSIQSSIGTREETKRVVGLDERMDVLTDVVSTLSNPRDFRWVDAPLNGIKAPLTAVVVYLSVVGLLVAHMRSRGKRPYAVPDSLAAGHNVALSVGSAVMFVGTAREVLRRSDVEGWNWILCESSSSLPTAGALYYWSYVYYLSKYYELLDTIIGLLRGSRMPNFKLQVYHHVCVVLMAWLWCETAQSLQFGGLLFNTLVHVVMYLYYAARVLKIHVPKVVKMSITMFQIVQFTTSFVLLLMSASEQFRTNACTGYARDEYYSLLYNAGFNATLLVSFVGVFNTNKKNKTADTKKHREGSVGKRKG